MDSKRNPKGFQKITTLTEDSELICVCNTALRMLRQQDIESAKTFLETTIADVEVKTAKAKRLRRYGLFS